MVILASTLCVPMMMVTIKNESSMLGMKEIPPSLGTKHLCTFLWFGISYKFFLLQKLSKAGIKKKPQMELRRNAPMMAIVYSNIFLNILSFNRCFIFFYFLLY